MYKASIIIVVFIFMNVVDSNGISQLIGCQECAVVLGAGKNSGIVYIFFLLNLVTQSET